VGNDSHSWPGLVFEKGKPCIQASGPYAGFYVSGTSLKDETKTTCDPARQQDSTTIPYVSVPSDMLSKIAVGDLAVVLDLGTQKWTAAIVGDVGPKSKFGEASIAVAKALGRSGDVKHGGGIGAERIAYLFFPKSGNGKARPVAEIASEGQKLLDAWGGLEQ